jgi:hypothetical protein
MEHSTKHPPSEPVAINGIRGTFEQSNLRKEERFLAERSIQALYNGKTLEMWLVDCSSHGIQIVSRQHFDCGERLQIIIQYKGAPAYVPYEVRYWFKLWSDTFQLGAELTESLSPDEEKLLLQELLAPNKR